MDALFQIVVPEIKQVDLIETIQPVYEYDGVKYPQGPKVISWRDVSASLDEPTQYLQRFLPAAYLSEHLIWLKVSDETLDRYKSIVNTESEDLGEIGLEAFIHLLLKDLDKWVVAFILHWDQIDNVYQVDVDGAISKLRDNLRRNTQREGFVAYK